MGQQIDDLMGREKPITENRYYPVWLRIITRNGKYFLGHESLKEEVDTCLRIEGRSLYGWLKDNNLSIKEISKSNYVILKG